MWGRLERYYGHLPIGILLLTKQDVVVYANPAYGRILAANVDALDDSEAHGVLLEEYQRRLRNRDSYTLRLIPDEEDEPLAVLDLFFADMELHGIRMTCISLVPVTDRDRFVTTKERDDYIFGRMRVNVGSGLARYGARVVPFTPTEFRLFSFLCQNADRVFPKQELLRRVWGQSATQTRTVDMCISRIRKKLRDSGCMDELIHTQFGRGYTFLLQWET